MVTDFATNEIWAYTASEMFLLHVVDESRGIWKMYLDRARSGEGKYFETALRHCRTEAEAALVTRVSADYYFHCGSFEMSARYFARTHRPLEGRVDVYTRVVGCPRPICTKNRLAEAFRDASREAYFARGSWIFTCSVLRSLRRENRKEAQRLPRTPLKQQIVQTTVM